MAKKIWTPAEEETLSQLAAAGCCMPEILQVLKSRDKSAIVAKAYRMGIEIALESAEIDMEAFNRLMKAKKER